jgi:hypothetical protein
VDCPKVTNAVVKLKKRSTLLPQTKYMCAAQGGERIKSTSDNTICAGSVDVF